MSDADSLQLRSVLARFNDAGTALESLRERLRALALTEDTQERAAEALGATAQQLGAFVQEIERSTEGLLEACARATQALSSAEAFLADTDLGSVHRAVADMATRFDPLGRQVESQAAIVVSLDARLGKLERVVGAHHDEVLDSIRTLGSMLAGKVDGLNALFDLKVVQARQEVEQTRGQRNQLGAEFAELQRRHQKLEQQVAAVPEKIRKKVGL